MTGNRTARWILTIVGIYTAIGPWIFDFGATHMYNDRWPPHAKFHNGQTLLFGSVLGILTIYHTWRGRGGAAGDLSMACLLGSLFWITQAGAGLLPNTALVDPEFAAGVPKPFGLSAPQPVIDVVALLVIGTAYLLGKVGHDRSADRSV